MVSTRYDIKKMKTYKLIVIYGAALKEAIS